MPARSRSEIELSRRVLPVVVDRGVVDRGSEHGFTAGCAAKARARGRCPDSWVVVRSRCSCASRGFFSCGGAGYVCIRFGYPSPHPGAGIHPFVEVTLILFVQSLLFRRVQVKPELRPSLDEILNHPFLRNGGPPKRFSTAHGLRCAASSSSAAASSMSTSSGSSSTAALSSGSSSGSTTLKKLTPERGIPGGRPPLTARSSNLDSGDSARTEVAHGGRLRSSATTSEMNGECRSRFSNLATSPDGEKRSHSLSCSGCDAFPEHLFPLFLFSAAYLLFVLSCFYIFCFSPSCFISVSRRLSLPLLDASSPFSLASPSVLIDS